MDYFLCQYKRMMQYVRAEPSRYGVDDDKVFVSISRDLVCAIWNALDFDGTSCMLNNATWLSIVFSPVMQGSQVRALACVT